MKPDRFKPTSGFTLIELLVVTAIIVLLIAIALPALGGARHRAKAATGLMNLRQIGVGFMNHASEHMGYFPFGFDGTRTYAHFLTNYLPVSITDPVMNIFVSPLAEKKINRGPFTIAITYSAHGGVCRDRSGGGPDLRIPLDRIADPTRLILLADGSQIPNNNNQSTATYFQPGEVFGGSVPNREAAIPVGPDVDDNAGAGYFRYRDKGKLQALMADGHAEAFKKGEVRYANVMAE
jgi:prepilin-type N-terminal cleavage/methylation domain-containing protein/prepilin-type processing-associated H-X9-DG protein